MPAGCKRAPPRPVPSGCRRALRSRSCIRHLPVRSAVDVSVFHAHGRGPDTGEPESLSEHAGPVAGPDDRGCGAGIARRLSAAGTSTFFIWSRRGTVRCGSAVFQRVSGRVRAASPSVVRSVGPCQSRRSYCRKRHSCRRALYPGRHAGRRQGLLYFSVSAGPGVPLSESGGLASGGRDSDLRSQTLELVYIEQTILPSGEAPVIYDCR